MVLILLDFDGVLADTLGDLLQFGQEACDELGVQHIAVQEDLSSLEVMSFATYGHQMGVPDSLLDEFVRRCLEKFARKKSPPAIFDGLTPVIQRLAEGHTLAVVTGNSTENVTAFLAAHGLGGCVRAIFGVDAPGTKVEKIKRARSRFGAEAESVFMVGDSVSDIRAAQEASVKSIAVGWGHQSAERLVKARPDFLVNTPTELLNVIQKENADKKS